PTWQITRRDLLDGVLQEPERVDIPFSTADVQFLASSSEMWGGSGGTFGSVIASKTNGRLAANARSHAAPSAFGSLTRTPSRPSDLAYSAYGKSGSSCDASNFGSPARTRSSHVTMLRSRLLSTSTIIRGSVHSFQYFATVMSSVNPFICIAPSPAIAIATRS